MTNQENNTPKNIEELVEKLHNAPLGSYDWYCVKREIVGEMADVEKYKENVLVFRSMNIKSELPVSDLNLKIPHLNIPNEGFFLRNGVVEVDWKAISYVSSQFTEHEQEFIDEMDDYIREDYYNRLADVKSRINLFHEEFPFIQDKTIDFLPRYNVEHDVRYRQLVVVALITDGRKVLMLKTNDNNRIANKLTLVQGHVSYDSSIYFRPEMEYLRDSVLRELVEEINSSDDINKEDAEINLYDYFNAIVPAKPKYVVDRDENFADLEHFGIVYQIKIPSVDDFINNHVKSGESDKHELVAIDVAVDLESTNDQLRRSVIDQMDDWAKDIITAEFK